jgi:signal transduction histidine kinase
MALAFSIYQFSLAAAVLIAAGTAVFAWQHRGTPGARSLVALLLGETIWSGCAFVMTFDPFRGTAATVPWVKALIVGVMLTVLGAFFFVLEYTGRERFLTPRWIAALSALPFGLVVLTVVDPAPLVWVRKGPDPYAIYGQVYEYGPVFEVTIVYIYALLAIATVWILRFALTSDVLYRGQIYGILVAVVVPWSANVVHQLDLVTYNPTPASFAVAGVAYSWTIFRGGLLDIAPIARRTVVERIDSGMLVVDTNGRVIDANSAAVSLFGTDRTELLGSPIDAHLDWAGIRPDGTASATTETSVGDTDLRIEISPLTDDLDRFVGHVVLLQDITELKRRERQLREQNRQLDRFASVVSHDLRNPLNVVSGTIELAMETGDLDRLAQAQDGVERMETLIDDMLTLARDRSDAPDRTPVTLASVASDAWETVETHDATLVIDVPITVEADPLRLRQLFENLFRNAVEHSHGDVTVTVGSYRTDGDDMTGFFVADDGPGIPPDEREQVLEDGFSTSSDGTGLGLSIVQGIVESHGWTITITESEHGGARFEVGGVATAKPAEPDR